MVAWDSSPRQALAAVLPKQLKAELDLARCGGRAVTHASRWRNARGSEDNGIGQIEMRAVKKVEYLRPKLKIQPPANPRVFQHGEVPSGQARPDQRVPSDVSIEPAICRCVRRCQKRIGVKPLARVAKNHWPGESWIRERAHRIPRIPIIRGVVAELRRKREATLQRHDGVHHPTARRRVPQSLQTTKKALPAPDRQRISRVCHRNVSDVESP